MDVKYANYDSGNNGSISGRLDSILAILHVALAVLELVDIVNAMNTAP